MRSIFSVFSVACGAAMCLGVSVMVGINPARATFPGREGLIAYVLVSGSHSDIWTLNPDNGAKKRLTSVGRNNWPRWSADGRRIAYSVSGNLWVMNANGTSKREVTTTGSDLKPAWSPDGKQLVFIRLQSNGHGDLFRMPSAGGAATRLTDDATNTGGDDRPTWSPNGKQILFEQYVGSDNDPSIRFMSSTGGAQSLVPAAQGSAGYGAGSEPDWAPDGQHVFFLADCNPQDGCYASDNVNVANLTGGTRTQLTGYDGYDEDTSMDDAAIAPDSGTDSSNLIIAPILEEGFDIRTQKFAFIGLDVGYRAAHAIHPDWQPVP